MTSKNQIILKPVRVLRSDDVRAKLAELALADEDLAQAVDWARAPAAAPARSARHPHQAVTTPRSSTVRRVSTLISLTFGLKRAPTTGSSAGFDLAV